MTQNEDLQTIIINVNSKDARTLFENLSLAKNNALELSLHTHENFILAIKKLKSLLEQKRISARFFDSMQEKLSFTLSQEKEYSENLFNAQISHYKEVSDRLKLASPSELDKEVCVFAKESQGWVKESALALQTYDAFYEKYFQKFDNLIASKNDLCLYRIQKIDTTIKKKFVDLKV